MGEFCVELLAPNGRTLQRVVLPNILHWEGEEDLVKRFFNGGTSKEFTMGFCGATLWTRFSRPNKTTAEVVQDFLTTFSDFTHAAANEGGVPDDDSRECVGYERQAIEWTFRRDGSHWCVESDWLSWTNPHTWDFHGTWYEWNDVTEEWVEDVKGLWEQWPYEPEWAPIHGFPWNIPLIHPNYLMGGDFVDAPPGEGGGYPDPHVKGAFYAGNLHRLGGYPITVFFIVDSDDKLVASCTVSAPMLWRPGHTLRCRYAARLHGKTPHQKVVGIDWWETW